MRFSEMLLMSSSALLLAVEESSGPMRVGELNRAELGSFFAAAKRIRLLAYSGNNDDNNNNNNNAKTPPHSAHLVASWLSACERASDSGGAHLISDGCGLLALHEGAIGMK